MQFYSGFRALMRCATLCNRAEFIHGEEDKPIQNRKVRGDASEEAILKFVEFSHVHGDPNDFRHEHPKLLEIPFSSVTKHQVSGLVFKDPFKFNIKISFKLEEPKYNQSTVVQTNVPFFDSFCATLTSNYC